MLVSCNKGSRANPEGIEFHSYNISFFVMNQNITRVIGLFVFSLLNAIFIKYGYNYSFHFGSYITLLFIQQACS